MAINWTEYLTDVVEYILLPNFSEVLYNNTYVTYRKECPVGIRDSYNRKKVDLAAIICRCSINDHKYNKSEDEDVDWDVHCFEIKQSTSDMNTGNGINFYGDYNWLVVPHRLYDYAVKRRNESFKYVNIVYVKGEIGEIFLNNNEWSDLIEYDFGKSRVVGDYRGVCFDDDLTGKIATNIFRKNYHYSNISYDNTLYFYDFTGKNDYDTCIKKYKELYVPTNECIIKNGIYDKYKLSA